MQLVGTPDYGLDGCPPGYYRSAIVVRADDPRKEISDFRDGVFAYNQTFSQSGYAAPYWHVKSQGFWFENRVHTEQHLKSARVVAEGQADIASLDGVSWRLMEQYEPFAKNLRVLAFTEPTPGLPLITSMGQDAGIVFAAVKSALAQLDDDMRDLLGIRDIVKIDKADYLAIPNPDEDTG